MTVFEPRSSSIGSDRSVKCATATALTLIKLICFVWKLVSNGEGETSFLPRYRRFLLIRIDCFTS